MDRKTVNKSSEQTKANKQTNKPTADKTKATIQNDKPCNYLCGLTLNLLCQHLPLQQTITHDTFDFVGFPFGITVAVAAAFHYY